MPLNKAGFPIKRTYVPWHNMGTDVSDCTESKFVIHKAGLNWWVGMEPAFALVREDTGCKSYQAVDGCRFSLRFDAKDVSGTVLGAVGGGFIPAQNKDTFAVFDGLSSHGLVFERAGEFHGGRQVWMVARLGDGFVPVGNGCIQGYLVLRNHHDGSGSLEVQFVPMDVETQTCIALPIPGQTQHIRFRHAHSLKKRTDKASLDVLSSAESYLDANLAALRSMEAVRMGDAMVGSLLLKMFPDAVGLRPSGVPLEARSNIHGQFRDSDNRTAVDMWIAICGHLDHNRADAIRAGRAQPPRMASILWGKRSVHRARLGRILIRDLQDDPATDFKMP